MLAQFASKGPWQTALLASSTLTLATVLPPMVWFSAAAIAFYVMRHGWRSGLIATAIAAAGAALFHALTLGQVFSGGAWFGLYAATAFWSPVFLVALVLRATERLEIAALMAFALSLFVVVGVYLYADSPRALWTEHLGQFVRASGEGLDPDRLAQTLDSLARFGTGMFASGVLMNTLIGVFLGRSWQARLYQPGGFQAAFHAFRLPRGVSVALAATVAAAWVTDADALIALAMPAAVLLAVQGLAVVHGIVGIRQMGIGWLIALYCALMLVYSVVLIGLLGLVDAVVDFRRRASARLDSD